MVLCAVISNCAGPVFTKEHFYPEKHSKVQTIQGIRTHFLDITIGGNTGNQTPLLFVHGWLGSGYDFYQVVLALQKGSPRSMRILVPDLPGLGFSEKPDIEYSMGYYVQFLHAFIQHLDLQDVILIGNSMGGNIVVRYAFEHPEAVRRIVLIGPDGLKDEEGAWLLLARLGPIVDLGMMLNNRLFIDIAVRLNMFYDASKIDERFLDSLTVSILSPEGRTAAARITKHVLGTAPVNDILPFVQTPALVIWGKQDRMLDSRWADVYHAMLPFSELVILDECGHMPTMEAAGTVASLITRFSASGFSETSGASRR